MAKEINVTCDLLTKQLVCELPYQTMDVLLKVRIKTGEHTFREDVYTLTLKYRRWNNDLKPFRSLKRRVANIFHKGSSLSIVEGHLLKTIVNHMESEEETSIVNNDKRDSIHSDWSDLIPVNEEVEYGKIYKNRNEPNIIGVVTTSAASAAKATRMPSVPPAKKKVKNIVLVPYTPRQKDWGSWWISLPYATSTVVNPPAVHKQASQEEKEEEGELVCEPHSPYYSPVHPPKFL